MERNDGCEGAMVGAVARAQRERQAVGSEPVSPADWLAAARSSFEETSDRLRLMDSALGTGEDVAPEGTLVAEILCVVFETRHDPAVAGLGRDHAGFGPVTVDRKSTRLNSSH